MLRVDEDGDIEIDSPEDLEIYPKLANMVCEMIKEDGNFWLWDCGWSKNKNETTEKWTLVINCNDVFAWACADMETVPLDKIEEVYNIWKSEDPFGVVKWVSYRRKERPQNYIDYKDRLNGFEWTDEDEEKIK